MNKLKRMLCNVPVFLWICFPLAVIAQSNGQQNKLPLTDLSAFKLAKSWQIAGDVIMNPEKAGALSIVKGTGVLVNVFDEKKKGEDLLTQMQHGDMDMEMDYMMARGSNSGIYLQGLYEIQLADSWGATDAKASDNGGIYERWDDARPEGQRGYDGHAPRQNVTRAPGVWQHIKISFQAPKFDGAGKKTENARILLVELNGIRIQDNVELSGPTRGALSQQETANGPLRLQGDHGSVAFRNISYTLYNKPRPELLNLNYAVYKGKFDGEPDYKTAAPEAKGTSVLLSSNVNTLQNDFLIHYTGDIKVAEPGEYSFNLSVPGGSGIMRVAGNPVVTVKENGGTGKVTLKAGTTPFDLYYSKVVDWARPALGLVVAGPGVREYLISDGNVPSSDMVDPILINVTGKNSLLRCFIDLRDGKRVTHAINVGSSAQVHYTYDADNGMLVQLWRGGFLDATPMWHDRGDGSSRATGFALQFGSAKPAINKLSDATAAWGSDTTGTGFKTIGYKLDKDKKPAFSYSIYGTVVTDATTVLDGGQGIERVIELQQPADKLYYRVVAADKIEEIGKGLYIINDKSYYLHLSDDSGKPIIRNSGLQEELIVPISKKLTYSILF
ncbi:DUF1080 domain-containing protein [Mucilaginibacter roseus]|uniref:DUF1080 domain-containing protein n=1 Tax=Mucilaginibacter roseus TaxID=1528868 RepID=A0ABS8U7D5_9SPHI|nr:DUF1080 domain-containing protein [Mucilaginibacter roseus]MCD8742100.1 DUF1080 domain-containing protein [Mucilaginibacter roseus]